MITPVKSELLRSSKSPNYFRSRGLGCTGVCASAHSNNYPVTDLENTGASGKRK